MVEGNMRRAMACFARAAPGSEVREMPGVTITNAAVDSPVFNAAFLSEGVGDDPTELDRRIAIAKVYYDARGLPWSFWVCDGMLAKKTRRRAARVFDSRGMRSVTDCPGMIAQSLAPTGRELPGLSFRAVSDSETQLTFAHITSLSFCIPFATSMEIYGNPATWETEFHACVGYLDGTPVATAATVDACGAIGLYSVATLPEHQGRGIGEAITRYAVEQAIGDAGSRPVVLQSTRQGESLYSRLGFRDVTRISVYVGE